MLETIRTKRAVRKFQDRPVPEETIREILDAGRLSQSSKNTQPWDFIVVRDRQALQQLSTCGTYAGHMAGAAFAVVIASSVEDRFDIGQSAAYLQLAAWELGVGSCLVFFHQEGCPNQVLGIPADKKVEYGLSFGYPAEDTRRPPRKSGRRSFAEVVHWEKWQG